MPRTLIFGTSYCATPEKKWLCERWHETTSALNPGHDVLVVDFASPCLPPGMHALNLGDNIGHLSTGGQDGWGRAFCKGLEIAISGHFDWVVHIESDLLFARPVDAVIERMAANGVLAAAPMANPYPWIETGLIFLNVDYIRKIDFIGQYDWKNSREEEFPEMRVEALLGERFMALPLRGIRNVLNQVNPENIGQGFYSNMTWITQANTATYRAFLEMNGLLVK